MTFHGTPRLHVHEHLLVVDRNRIGLECLFFPKDIQQLYPWREIRPLDNLPRTNVKTRAMEWTLDLAAIDDFASL
jgi:hypothetical protein